jgi:hypothetical protein
MSLIILKVRLSQLPLYDTNIELQAYRLIFTSPQSADTMTAEHLADPIPRRRSSGPPVRQKGPSRDHNAALIGLRTVTPKSVAYVACQVCHFSFGH